MTTLDNPPMHASPLTVPGSRRPTLTWIVVLLGCASVSGSIAVVDELAGWIGR